jgi:hypothetical protein
MCVCVCRLHACNHTSLSYAIAPNPLHRGCGAGIHVPGVAAAFTGDEAHVDVTRSAGDDAPGADTAARAAVDVSAATDVAVVAADGDTSHTDASRESVDTDDDSDAPSLPSSESGASTAPPLPYVCGRMFRCCPVNLPHRLEQTSNSDSKRTLPRQPSYTQMVAATAAKVKVSVCSALCIK